ncbi:MAG: hypothetical protein JO261_14975 [Alphaproteobacteria bacterium]|nr:hypothetical protein [Alphaproteobacteria bacterium]
MAALPARAQDCLRVQVPIAAGAIAKTDAFADAACGKVGIPNPFHYESRLGASIAERPLMPGDVVPRYPDFGVEELSPGDTVDLEARAGNILIARKVEVLQRARPGQRLFVKAADGSILSVAFEELAR